MAGIFFSALWFFTGGGYFWPGWIIGIAVVMTLMNLFGEVIAFSESDYRKWKRKRATATAGRAETPAG